MPPAGHEAGTERPPAPAGDAATNGQQAAADDDGQQATVWMRDLPAMRGARLDGSLRVAKGLKLGLAFAVVLEVLLQALAFWASPAMQGRAIDPIVAVGVGGFVSVTTVIQVRSALSREARSRTELAAALLQVRPALLLWRSVAAENRTLSAAGSAATGTAAGLEQLSPELHRLSVVDTSEVESTTGGVSNNGTEYDEVVVDASVGTHALMRTGPVASLLALRWWAVLSRCLPACATEGAPGDGGTTTLIALSLFSSACTLSLAFTRCCAGELSTLAARQPRADPSCMTGLTFVVLLLGVICTLWISTVVRMATFSLYVVAYGDVGALTCAAVSSLLTACFFQYEKSLGAFLGTHPGVTPSFVVVKFVAMKFFPMPMTNRNHSATVVRHRRSDTFR